MIQAPQAALDALAENPELTPQFREKYGYLPAPSQAIQSLRERPELSDQFKDKYGYLPDDTETPTPTIPEEKEDIGRLQTAASEFVKGAGGISSGTLKGIGVQESKRAGNTLDLMDKIDRGEITSLSEIGLDVNDYNNADVNQYLQNKEAPIPALINKITGEEGDIRTRLRQKNTKTASDPRQNELFQAGEKIDQFLQNQFQSNPEFQQEFITGKVPGALGSMVGFVLSTLVGKGVGGAAGGVLATAGTGAAVNSQSQFLDAIDNGASLSDAFEAADIGGLVGTSEIVPIARILNRLDKGSGGAIKRSIVNAIKGGTEEAAQEVFQQVMNNLSAQAIYDPERGMWMDSKESGELGFTTGALVSALGTLIGGRRRPTTKPDQTPELTPDAEQAEAETTREIFESESIEQVVDKANEAADQVLSTELGAEVFDDSLEGQLKSEFDETMSPETAQIDQNITELDQGQAQAVSAVGDMLAQPTATEGQLDVPIEPDQSGLALTPDQVAFLEQNQADRRTTDRRQDVTTRKMVAEMTPEERAEALLTDELMGIPNYRAFQEHRDKNPAEDVLFGDIDDFKSYNTKYGHSETDKILQHMGDIQRQIAGELGMTGYRRSGDEFLASGTPEQLEKYGAELQNRLANAIVEVELPDGTTATHQGIGFSFGVGKNEQSAEQVSDQQKRQRKEAGLRQGERDVTPVLDETAERDEDQTRVQPSTGRDTGLDEQQPELAADELIAELDEGKPAPAEQKEKPKRFQQLTAKQASDRGLIKNVDQIDNYNEIAKFAVNQGVDVKGKSLEQLQNEVKFSKTKAPGFYSQLQRATASIKQEKGTADQFLAMIKKQPGVKAEELEWTGVEEYLRAQGLKKITKQEIETFVENNGVQVDEVKKQDQIETERNIKQEEDGTWTLYDNLGLDAIEVGFATQRDAENWAATNSYDDGSPNDQTEYSDSDYQLPGGENYREVLLTLPKKAKSETYYQSVHEYARNVIKPLREKEGIARGATSQQEKDFEEKYAKEFTELNRLIKLRDNAEQEESDSFESSHFDEPNILAHMRINDRIDSDGNKVLFVEEIQSDWHQEGRKKGYKNKENQKRAMEILKKHNVDIAKNGFMYQLEQSMKSQGLNEYQGKADRFINSDYDFVNKYNPRTGSGLPDAPFKGNAWAELSIKRILRMAAEEGYDSVSWTTGKQQIDRYEDSLRKNIDAITYEKDEDGTYIVSAEKNGEEVFEETGADINRVEELLGKDIASKIESQEGRSLSKDRPLRPNAMIIEGDNLSIGGEGMKGFYDRTLPNLFKKVARKLDKSAVVSDTKIEAGKVNSIQITDAMRQGAMQGQPLFSKEKVSYTPNAKLPKGKKALGLRPERVQQIVDDFMSGVKSDVSVRVFAKQSDIGELKDNVKAFVAGKNIGIVAENLGDPSEVEANLRHEVFGHFGFSLFDTQTQKTIEDKINATRNDEKFAHTWEGVLRDYKEQSKSVQAQEFFARYAEIPKNKLTTLYSEVLALIQKGLRALGWIKTSLTESELQSFLSSARRQTKRGGKEPQGEPALLFSKKPANPVQESALKKAGIIKEKRNIIGRAREYMDLGWDNAKQDIAHGADVMAQGMVDRLHAIKKVEKAVHGILPAEQSGYVAARLSAGVDSVMRAVLHHGAPQWKDGIVQRKEKTKGLLKIFESVRDDFDSWAGWMIGNRAKRLMSEGRERNFTKEEIEELIALGKGKEAQFETVAKEYDAFKKSVLDLAEQAGLINPETRSLWDLSDYIPFYRVTGSEDVKRPQSKQGLSHQTSGIRRLKGGEAGLGDPMENIVMNFAHLIDASMKNHALRRTLVNLKDTDIIERAPMKMGSALIPMSQVKAILMDQNVDVSRIDKKTFEGIQKMLSIQVPTDPDVVRVMDGGKAKYFRVNDPMLLESLTAINDQGLNNALIRVLRAPKRLLTAAVTASPDFMIRNFIRDSMASWVVSEDHFRLGVDSIRGAMDTLAEKDGTIDMMFSGASFLSGYVDATDPGKTSKSIRRALRKKGFSAAAQDEFLSTIIDTPAKLWEKYRDFGDAMENASREAVYSAAIKAGKSKAEAVFQAKDLMDFSMQGNWGAIQTFNAIIPFLNARLQGLYKLGRSGAIPAPKIAKKRAMKRGMALALASVALYAVNADDERYQELPEWDKDLFWHFFVGDKHFRIPKPFEVGVLYGTIPERATARMLSIDDNKKSFERLMWNMSEVFNFNPLHIQGVQPLMESAFNYDMFGDRPIENMAERGRLPADRYNEHTSDLMKAIGRKIGDQTGLSPMKLEHIWNGYLGTMGAYVLSMADIGYRWAVNAPTKPAIRMDQIPVIRSLYREDPPFATKYQTEFYELYRRAEQAHKSVNHYEEHGQPQKALETFSKYEEKMNWRKFLQKEQRKISKINKNIDLIYSDPKMSAKEKRKAIDELFEERNTIFREAVQETEIPTPLL